jgi:hypothetical protein
MPSWRQLAVFLFAFFAIQSLLGNVLLVVVDSLTVASWKLAVDSVMWLTALYAVWRFGGDFIDGEAVLTKDTPIWAVVPVAYAVFIACYAAFQLVGTVAY